MMNIKFFKDTAILDGMVNNQSAYLNPALEATANAVVDYIRGGWSSSSPSSPGQPPAIVTGNLDESVHAENTGRSGAGTFAKGSAVQSWFVQVEAEYAAALEFGSPSTNLAPRPFISPALDAALPFLVAGLKASYASRI